MSGDQEAADRHVALADASRRRLLGALRTAGHPLGVDDLAATVQLHVTTVRHHLQTLERAGLVRRTVQPARGPGRPRQLYSATAADSTGPSRDALADLLATALSWDTDGGRGRAEQVGHTWAQREEPAGPVASLEDAVRRMHHLFERLGFAPRWVHGDDRHQLELTACPFRDIARAHPEAVCSVHLGLLRGALERMGVAGAEAGLRPFVEPELCIADIRPAGTDSRRTPLPAP